ncbi:auxilin-related protein 2-like [Brassica napus]|uniref:auxilin-related protein 2-like n=1 Tax=Brassica napus TaxID=3708 RepID=UPI0006AAD9B9|nr:auxilin-related protein 2-like [Brassica napus]
MLTSAESSPHHPLPPAGTAGHDVGISSSPVSSFIREEEYETEEKQRTSKAEDEDEEEMSSYVIEVNSDRFDRYRDGGSGGGNSDSNDMDEAIAWARERSQRPETKQAQEDLIDSRRSEEEEAKSEEEMEMEMKDEEIRIWLTGKETNIGLLLSTLHHVLWSNSIWQAIPLANLRDGSQVKSVASRVFSILQEAWAVYLTNEGLSS